MLDEYLSGIALNAGKLVQTQTTLSADQLKKGDRENLSPMCGSWRELNPRPLSEPDIKTSALSP